MVIGWIAFALVAVLALSGAWTLGIWGAAELVRSVDTSWCGALPFAVAMATAVFAIFLEDWQARLNRFIDRKRGRATEYELLEAQPPNPFVVALLVATAIELTRHSGVC